MVIAAMIDNANRQIEKAKGRSAGSLSAHPSFQRKRMVSHLAMLSFILYAGCKRSKSRIIIAVSSLLFEVFLFSLPSFTRFVQSRTKTIHALLIFSQMVAGGLLDSIFRPVPLRIPGIPAPPKGLPAGSSGDPRILVGGGRVVEMPYSLDVGSVLTLAANSAIHGGAPFVAGDDISVIIVARDEDEFLSKTIKYTYESAPRSMLREFIVVDDASSNLQADILDRELPPDIRRIVRTLRFDTKEGLIRARIAGADMAEAANIFFLDGHCRPTPGWLPPLIQHLKVNYKRLACPTIFDIRRDTWEDAGTSGAKMMFDWTFEFGWYDDLTDEVPLSAGGIFAMTKRWWEESGKYDPGMLEWGGENIEQSMRVWLCGGDIYVVRHSKVGHIFDRPAKPNPEGKLVRQVQTNQKRAALVWLDDYYKYFETFHSVVKSLDEGPGLEERRAIRQRLRCKPFQWYVDKFKTSFERKGLLVDNYLHIQHSRSRWCLTAVKADPNATDSYRKNAHLVVEPCVHNDARQMFLAVAGNRMLQVKQDLQCFDTNMHSWRNISKSLSVRPIIQSCDWNEVFKAKNRRQFWQFDGAATRRIFTYDTDAFKTLTGNDPFPISSTRGIDGESRCLAANLKFEDADIQAKSEEHFKQFGLYPSDTVLEPCRPGNAADGLPSQQEWQWTKVELAQSVIDQMAAEANK